MSSRGNSRDDRRFFEMARLGCQRIESEYQSVREANADWADLWGNISLCTGWLTAVLAAVISGLTLALAARTTRQLQRSKLWIGSSAIARRQRWQSLSVSLAREVRGRSRGSTHKSKTDRAPDFARPNGVGSQPEAIVSDSKKEAARATSSGFDPGRCRPGCRFDWRLDRQPRQPSRRRSGTLPLLDYRRSTTRGRFSRACGCGRGRLQPAVPRPCPRQRRTLESCRPRCCRRSGRSGVRDRVGLG